MNNQIVSVSDVAEHILQRLGAMSAMKLQKLCYYAQAWHLVWIEKPLFSERIEAWANGPVVPDLYSKHRGMFRIGVGTLAGDPGKLSTDSKDVVERVLGFYGSKDPQWLSELTHMEAPWQKAREGLADGERANREITHDVIAEYYGSL